MASFARLILIFILISLPFGQMIRINFGNLSFPLVDPLILSLSLINFLYYRRHHLKTSNPYFIFFLSFGLFSLLLNFVFFHLGSIGSIFYFLRLSALISLLAYPPNILLTPRLQKTLIYCLVAFIAFGFIQYLFWPDFTYFSSQNWDPHLNRLVGSLFDPTFTALIILMFFIQQFFTNPRNYGLLALSYLALALTYSRSALVALLFGFTFLSIRLKKPVIFFTTLLVIIATIFLLPQTPGEGTNLKRTSTIKAKIVNYQEGLRLFSQYPLIGTGYNNLYQVRNIQNPLSHANNGFDGSLLTIAVTTGILGLALFLLGLKKEFSFDLQHQTLLIAILTHSLFANSLLYPWTILLLALFKNQKSH
jgi:hypothetical protein